MIFYSISVQVAQAAEVVKAIVSAVDTVFNVVINTVLGSIEVFLGALTGIDWLSDDGNCRLGNISGKVLKDYSDECDNGNGGGGGGAANSPTLQDQSNEPLMSADGACTTGYKLSYSVTDAYQYGIYRNNALIKSAVLNQHVQPSPYNESFSYTDNDIEPNKDYEYEVILFDKNGKQYRYPRMNVYSECIKLNLTVDLGAKQTTVYVPNNYVSINWETIAAISCVASGDWSGNKGPESGSENSGKLPRGISNPGQGKTYNFTLTCQYPKNKTVFFIDSVSQA